MNIHIVVVAYGLADDLLKLFYTANADNITWHLFLHSHIEAVVQACQVIRHASPKVHFYNYGYNRGLSASWNEGLYNAYYEGADVAMIANDDAIPAGGDVERIAQAALHHPKAYMVDGYGYDVKENSYGNMRFSLAAINPIALEKLGCFDENFFPIYYEDMDWFYRARLAGLELYTVPDTNIVHQGSKSLTITPSNLHHLTFTLNQKYYMRKWNGDKGSETFTIPFNDPRFDLHIPYSISHNPYGEYDRTDRHLAS